LNLIEFVEGKDANDVNGGANGNIDFDPEAET
jgi:hypothetical protein